LAPQLPVPGRRSSRSAGSHRGSRVADQCFFLRNRRTRRDLRDHRRGGSLEAGWRTFLAIRSWLWFWFFIPGSS
jgi:hypothetical protein